MSYLLRYVKQNAQMIHKELNEQFGMDNYSKFKALTKQANINLTYFRKLKSIFSQDSLAASHRTKRKNRTVDIDCPSKTQSINVISIGDARKNIRNSHILKQKASRKLSFLTLEANNVHKSQIANTLMQVRQQKELISNRNSILKEGQLYVKPTKMKQLYYRLQQCVRPTECKFETRQPANGNHTFQKLSRCSASVKKMSILRDISVSKLNKR